MFTRRDFLWNYYLNKAIFDREADANGVQVGKEELLALQFGNNISPVIQQRFMNPQTGSIDFQQLNEIRQQIESGMMPEETRSEEHTSELQSRGHLVCRLLLEKKNKI